MKTAAIQPKRGLFRLLAAVAMLGAMAAQVDGNQMHHGTTGKLGNRDGMCGDFRRAHLCLIKYRRAWTARK